MGPDHAGICTHHQPQARFLVEISVRFSIRWLRLYLAALRTAIPDDIFRWAAARWSTGIGVHGSNLLVILSDDNLFSGLGWSIYTVAWFEGRHAWHDRNSIFISVRRRNRPC